jgi:tetratricopeptide (TPR) repeat protein
VAGRARVKPAVFAATLAAALLLPALAARAQSPSRQDRKRPAPKTPAAPAPQQDFDREVRLGDEAREARRFPEAIDHYAKALQIRQKWEEGWWYLGAIFYETDRYPEARDAFRNVVALNPKRGPAWGMLGLCEFQTREYEPSVRSLQRGRMLGFDGNQEIESVVRYHTALLYIHFDQFEIAYDILSEYVRLGNDSPKVIQAFGLAMLRQPFLPNEIPPDKREQVMIAGRAGFYMSARQPNPTKAAFDELTARYPDSPGVHYCFGVYLLGQDADAAMKEFKRELELSPSHFPSMVQLAFEYLKRDEYEQALSWAEKGVQLAPNLYAARNVLGRALLELGQVDRAVKELEAGVALAPGSPEMHFALARAYTRAGRKQDAARARETFKKLEEQFNADRARRDNLKPGGADNDQPRAKP